ncbi:MAG: MFS transporter [Candidatus Anstonellales archaeon]
MLSGMKKLNKNIVLLGFVSMLTDISSEMIFSILPIFMSSVLMLDKFFIGFIEGCAEATANLSKFLSPVLEKKFKRKKPVILFGYTLSTLVKPLFAFATSGISVFVLRVFERIGKGVRGPARDAIVADFSSKEIRGRAFGLHRMMDTIGAVIGPFFAFLILSLYTNDFPLVFLLSFIPGILSVLLLYLFVREPPHTEKLKTKTEMAVPHDNYVWFLLSASFFALGNMSFAFILIRVQELGMKIAFVPLAYLLFNVVYAFFSIPFGAFADRIGVVRALSFTYLLFFISFLGFAFSSEIWLSIIALIVYGIATAGSETLQRTLASQIVPKEKRTGGFATYQGITGLLVLPASLIAGFLWSAFSPTIAFVFSAACSLVALFLLQRIKR